MQDTDPKQPGFYVEPSTKGPQDEKFKKMTSIIEESEIPESIKRGVANEIVDVENLENLETSDQDFDEMPHRVESHDIPYGKRANFKPPILCDRCHSLRKYGKVKDPGVENLLPDFDFDHTVGRRLISVDGARTTVLLVVDAVDFDGSFPKRITNMIYKAIDENSNFLRFNGTQNTRLWILGNTGNVPRVILVVTKIDLLPSSISPKELEHWVRTRASESGAGRLKSVHLVSALKDSGVYKLVEDVILYSGRRGHVWAVGAQNSGKSTLLNAIGKTVGLKMTHLTEAPIPGTTLGILRMEGVLPSGGGKRKLFDTPGLSHPHQISTRLTRDEQKLARIVKELKPRTYRIKSGYSVHIGGLLRLDIEESSVDSIYVTVWASHLLPLHMGKTENASTLLEQHFGRDLQPPIVEGRVDELGTWVKKEFRVSGNSWDSSSVDIAAAGLGWFAIGLKGEAVLSVWTYDGVDIITRNALLPQISNDFEVAGFTVSEIVSKADRAGNVKNTGFKEDEKQQLG